jgi:nucleoid-associated protein EbfC
MSDEFSLESLVEQAMAMQEQLVAAQEQAAQQHVEGTAAGGLVRITLTGRGEPVSVRIDPDAIDMTDPGMLEDAVLAALRAAVTKVQELQSQTLGDIGGQLGEGGLGGLLGPG